MGRVRAEERGSGLGLVSGKLDKEEEKVAEEGLPKKYLETSSLEKT